jgi:hypothetical protein
MKARKLIEGAAYGTEAVKVIGEAFDKAWAQIAHHFNGNAEVVEAARIRLAHAVIAVAPAEEPQADMISNEALQVMAMRYKTICRPPPKADGNGALVRVDVNFLYGQEASGKQTQG